MLNYSEEDYLKITDFLLSKNNAFLNCFFEEAKKLFKVECDLIFRMTHAYGDDGCVFPSTREVYCVNVSCDEVFYDEGDCVLVGSKGEGIDSLTHPRLDLLANYFDFPLWKICYDVCPDIDPDIPNQHNGFRVGRITDQGKTKFTFTEVEVFDN